MSHNLRSAQTSYVTGANNNYDTEIRSQSRSILSNRVITPNTTNNPTSNMHQHTTNSNAFLKNFTKSASLAHLSNPYGVNLNNLAAYAAGSSQLHQPNGRLNGQSHHQNHQSVVPFASGFVSGVEAAILRSQVPIELSETEEITVNGHRGIYANRQEAANWRGPVPIHEYRINEDPNPEIINKKTNQTIEYVQELAIRYLRPPTPPTPGDIIINQEPNKPTSPAPAIILRQQPPRPITPEPLVIRECPPAPPCQIGKKIITISGKRLPPPPRKVIIERLAPLPQKPQAVLVERWLPYTEVKRRVIFNRPCEADPIVVKPKNVIVQWEAPQVCIRREFKYLGVIRASPHDYVQRFGNALLPSTQLPSVVDDFQTPAGLVLAAEHQPAELHELCGDVHALNYVDLEREGLGGYRHYLRGINGANSVTKSASYSNYQQQQNDYHHVYQNTHHLSNSHHHHQGVAAQPPPRPMSKQKVSIVETPTHQHTYAYPESSLIAESSLHEQQQHYDNVVQSTPFSPFNLVTQTETSHVTEFYAPQSTSYSLSNPASTASVPRQLYLPPSQLQNYPNLEQILAQYALQQQQLQNPSALGSARPTGSSTASAYLSSDAHGPYRSMSAASFGKRSATSAASSSGTTSINSALVESIFRSIDRQGRGRITVEDAEKVLLRLNSRLGRRYGEDDLKAFFCALDTNLDGLLDLDEFRRAFIGLKI